MKKLLIIQIIFYIILCQFNIKIFVYSKNNYARVDKYINLYKTNKCENSYDKILCQIEKSYFVQILSTHDDTYFVKYNSVEGYVKKNDVKEIINTPNTPYPSNIKLILGTPCNLRSTPTAHPSINNILLKLENNEDNFNFIGKIYSDEVIDFGGTLWYYVDFKGTKGYIYNKYVKSITPIPLNTEIINYPNIINSKIENPITKTPIIILTIILFIPSIFIILILYFPRKSIKLKSTIKKNTIDRY